MTLQVFTKEPRRARDYPVQSLCPSEIGWRLPHDNELMKYRKRPVLVLFVDGACDVPIWCMVTYIAHIGVRSSMEQTRASKCCSYN